MQRRWRWCSGLLLAAGCMAQTANTPARVITWQETVDIFRANNPTLLAGQVTIDEARADEITAFLRPNPNLGLALDQITPLGIQQPGNPNPPVGSNQASTYSVYRPLANAYPYLTLDYLHERRHKRELRLQSAQGATRIAIADQEDLQRTLLFSVRDAFVRLLQAKAVEQVARENLTFYDRQIGINQERFRLGAIAKVDFQRVELQRIQFESDLETSTVNVRTAKIDLQGLLRDRTPVEQFDIKGQFDFGEVTPALDELRRTALEARPDLRSAVETVVKARTDFQLAVANGSTDPTLGFIVSHQPAPLQTYLGFSVNIPLRIFDRNQGEKAHTQLDIGRTRKLQDAAEIGALHDVDSAYATLQSTLVLLRPYKAKYLAEANEIRSTVSFSYERGAASLLDFLDAQNQYRATQVAYLNLVGSYLSAANQLNMAVGREVIR